MIAALVGFFRTGDDRPVTMNEEDVARTYKRVRRNVFVSLVLGYGFFYTCRLSLSVAKKPLIDSGILGPEQLGIIGAALFYTYALGKFTNGFLSDRANIRRFMSVALFCSAVINLLFGSTSHFVIFAVLWAFNGWFQSVGSAPSVVSLCQWFSNKERGTFYGIWAGAHNIGEGLTFIGTSVLVSYFGWRWGFWGPGIACVIVAIILYYTLADRPQTYGLPSVVDFKQDFSAGTPTAGSVGSLQLLVLRSPAVWALGLASACMYVARYGFHSWGVLYLQEVKNYSLVEAGSLIGINTMAGLAGAALSGVISDRFFKSKRNVPTLLYGILLLGGLTVLHLTPAGHLWIDMIAVGCFEFAIGGLIVFLAGLTAVDAMPTRAAGSVKGVIGLFSYLGAATQDWVSGYLIEGGQTVVDAQIVHDFDAAIYFWLGASVLSMVFALLVWNLKARE